MTGIRAGRHIEALSRPDRAARRVVRVVQAALQEEATLLTHAVGATE